MLGCRFLDGTEFGNLLSFRSQKSKRSGNSLRCRSVCLNLPFNNRPDRVGIRTTEMTSQNPFSQPVRFLRIAPVERRPTPSRARESFDGVHPVPCDTGLGSFPCTPSQVRLPRFLERR